MAIADRTRKLLWGRSGNMCAYCRSELIMKATLTDEEAIVGDECHIIGQKPDAPRGDVTKSIEELDHYNNLILLCKTHHKMIDDQPDTFTIAYLHNLKQQHEQWVKSKLSIDKTSKSNSLHTATLPKVVNAKALIDILARAHSLLHDYDVPDNEDELSLLEGFIGEFEGISYLSDEPTWIVQASFRMQKQMQNLEAHGYFVYAKLTHGKLENKYGVLDWSMAIVVLRKQDYPYITVAYNPSIS